MATARTHSAMHESGLWDEASLGSSTPPHLACSAPSQIPDATRPLRLSDLLFQRTAEGTCDYTPLIILNVPEVWAGVEWQHCGHEDGVLLIPWAQRQHPAGEPLRWRPLRRVVMEERLGRRLRVEQHVHMVLSWKSAAPPDGHRGERPVCPECLADLEWLPADEQGGGEWVCPLAGAHDTSGD
jgi:hypothetical protein